MPKELRCPEETKSTSYEVIGGNTQLVIGSYSIGCGIWLSDKQDSLNGIAIYKTDVDQMAVGLRNGTNILGVAISVDDNGAGFLQLLDDKGECVHLDAKQLRTLLKMIQ